MAKQRERTGRGSRSARETREIIAVLNGEGNGERRQSTGEKPEGPLPQSQPRKNQRNGRDRKRTGRGSRTAPETTTIVQAMLYQPPKVSAETQPLIQSTENNGCCRCQLF